MWLDRNVSDNTDIPEKYKKLGYPESFKNNNPEFEYNLWNRKKVDELMQDTRLAKWKKFYNEEIKELIEKCDFARYCIIFIVGGVYSDLDFKCQKSLQPLIEGKEVCLVWEPQEHTDRNWDGVTQRLYNGFFMSAPNHWIWPSFMDWIVKHYRKGKSPLSNTGPVCFARFAKNYMLAQTYPEYFMPTCIILPLLCNGSITGGCDKDAVENSFVYTRWHEGTGWGALSVFGYDPAFNGMQSTTRQSLMIILIVLAFIILVGISVAVGLYIAKVKRKKNIK